MRTFTFPARVPVHKLAEFLIDPLGGVAMSKAYLHGLELEGVFIESSLIDLLPPEKVTQTRSVQCWITEFGVPFLDSHYRYTKVFTVGVFWFIVSSIATRVLEGAPVPCLDERPFDGVIMYVGKPGWNHPVPVNIYRDDGAPHLRVRSFPYNTSLWGEDTAILHL